MFLNLFNFSEPVHSFHFSDMEQMVLAGGVGSRLLAACLLGGAIGVEREYHKKSLGLRTNLLIKMFSLVYEVRGDDSSAIEGAVLKALDSQGKRLFDPERDVIAQIQRISFSVLGTRGQHQVLMATLRASPVIGQLHTYHDAEDE